MTKDETKKLLEVLRIAYPSAYKNMTQKDANGLLQLYYARFKDYPSVLVAEALNAYIDENEYPPTIAGIKKYITNFGGQRDYDEMFKELWSAICGNKKFSELSIPNQKYIGSQKALQDLGSDERTVMDVVRGQYMKRIPEIVESELFDRRVEKRVGSQGLAELENQMQIKGIVTKMLGDGNDKS